MFELYLDGPPGGLPLGITRLAAWLNDHGYKQRGGNFYISNVQRILRNLAYVGVALYNKRNARTGEMRPEDQWIAIPVPPIVSQEDFEAVQARLVEHRPANRPARVTTTNNLLIGLLKCGCDGDGCGGGMTTSTGKSGRYKYYACSNRARAGLSVCRGRRVPMAKLDAIALTAIEAQVLKPERLQALLSGWLDYSADASSSRREALRQLRSRQTALEAGVDRLLDLVAEGVLTATDERFSRKYAEQTNQLAGIKTDIVLLERKLQRSERRITPERLQRFSDLMREGLRCHNPALAQHYVRSMVDRIEVGDTTIKIVGANRALEHAICRFDGDPKRMVPNIEREWRTGRDSNP